MSDRRRRSDVAAALQMRFILIKDLDDIGPILPERFHPTVCSNWYGLELTTSAHNSSERGPRLQ